MLGESLFPVLAHGADAAQAASEIGLPPRQALTTSLTVEGLLFAAFSVSYNLATTAKDGGRHPFFARAWFGWLIVLVLLAVAASAASAWYATFKPDWPKSFGEQVRAFGLAAGIAAQPLFAAVINWQARK
jgi:hypothetical protein